jgi:Asp-tRNA(Asn)/Glu-tRNA(Gln) amidotransferase A subunit family amidase
MMIALTQYKDSPKEVEGAPSAVQLIGRPMKDEELLKIMNVVDHVLHPNREHWD